MPHAPSEIRTTRTAASDSLALLEARWVRDVAARRLRDARPLVLPRLAGRHHTLRRRPLGLRDRQAVEMVVISLLLLLTLAVAATILAGNVDSHASDPACAAATYRDPVTGRAARMGTRCAPAPDLVDGRDGL